MTNPRPEKTPDDPLRILPMELRAGDRLADETGEWEIINRPHTAAGGRLVQARVRRVDQPTTIEFRSWSAHERIVVRRTHA